MFKNYLKIAWRNLFKQKLYSFINIGGLAAGISCFIVMVLYISYERSFNTYYENHENIYRVYQQQHGNEYLGSELYASMPAPLAKTMKEEFPEVEEAVALQPHYALINTHDKNFSEEIGLKAESSFFKVFRSHFLLGNADVALNEINGIVLTEKLAKKYFGKVDVFRETIFLDGQTFQVTGIIKSPPDHVSFNYDFVFNIALDENYQKQKWMNNSPYVFMTLANGTTSGMLESKFPSFLAKYQQDDSYPFRNEYFVQPLSDLHFSSNINGDIGIRGNKTFVGIMLLIAIIILLLACINYINLSVARSVKRMKEVGVRKVIGAHKKQIMVQLLGESMLFSILALIIAIGTSYLLLPSFNELIERTLDFQTLLKPTYILGILLLLAIVSLLSGIYPAIVVSSLRPSQILKGNPSKIQKGLTVQKTLISCQYVASFVLVVGGIVVFQQMSYVRSKDLGYTKNHIVTIPIREKAVQNNMQSIKNDLISNAAILGVTSSNGLPNNIQSSTIINDEEGGSPEDDLAIYHTRVDFDYLDVFNIKLLAGRNFSTDYGTDLEEGYIINETAAKNLGWNPEEAIGKHFDHNGTETVIGVVKDFNMHSLHSKVEPLMISLTNYSRVISVKINPDQLSQTMKILEDTFSKYSSYPFEYQFLDERFDRMYKTEFRLGKTINYFSIIAVLLASFGLFGLAAIVTQQKTKEIGIRRVLGAPVNKMVILLTRDFLKTVLIAFFIAIPISLLLMNSWLQNFAYRITIDWSIYVATGLIAILITLLTVAYQAIASAMANPVKSLRTE
ncbi:ABC transporter permease [Croceitalea sp. MTPC5]|uniref:ABC transporter permease n=1 Tax=Croceitalea sp. MTPC5 TaxID=3056565 RepID=UPI002B3BBF67|nr:ABC transporter permease [Croceitalea sp. MTPC5]